MFPPISTASIAPTIPAATTTAPSFSVPAAPRKIGNQRVPENQPSQRSASVPTAAPVSAPVSAPLPVPAPKLGNYTVEEAEAPAPTPSALSDAPPLPSAYDDCAFLAPNDLLEALIKPAISSIFFSPLPPPPPAPLAPPPPPATFQGTFPSLTWQQELQEVSITFPQVW